MEDIVVVIITLLIIVIGAINQFRKKQKEPELEENNESEKPGLNFWEEFLEVENESGRETQNSEVEEVAVPVEKPKPQPIIEPANKEGVHFFDKNFIRDTIKNTEIGSQRKKANLPEGFSLKNAIVFSEIIHPKYF